ncbi:MAG: hypothetical protein J2P28_25855, partial [Actinobacteria bacterium]|nr:hypothetical protein [Actinomycetota bacterium]
MKALKLDTDGQLTELEITGSHLTAYYVAIKCDAVDVVAFEGCDMWLDDEGMYRQRPNLVATLVYQ